MYQKRKFSDDVSVGSVQLWLRTFSFSLWFPPPSERPRLSLAHSVYPSSRHITITNMNEVDAFNFTGEAIDISLRKFLAKVHLPKEVGQIDRMMETFAKRWHECNLGLMNSADGAYAVAFSILLLHTDAHNKSVKTKMNKETFIMRTRLIDGGNLIPPEILDIMFDNITYSKFVYAEDDIEPSSQLLLKGTDKQSTWFVKRGKSEPNLLGAQPAITSADLCPKLDQLMPLENPYSYKGTLPTLNTQQLHRAFIIAPSLRVTGVRSRQPEVTSPTSPSPARPLPTANITQDGASTHTSLTTPRDDSYVLKIAKAGVLERKFDLAQGGKKSNVRGWRPFGVILSGSQLILFSDVAAFLAQVDETNPHNAQNHNGQPFPSEVITPTFSVNSDDGASLVGSSSTASLRHHPTRSEPLSSLASSIPLSGPFPQPSFSTSSTSYSTISSTTPTRTALLRPSQILSLGSSVCLYDATYSKYPHTFRLIAGDGQQYMFRTESEEEMNDWIGKINYAATFKSAGIKLRGHNGRAGPRGKGRKEEAEKREEVMKAKLQDINTNIAQQSEQLNRDIQLRRNLAVLVPLQKSTRDRIMQYAETVGQRLKTTRVSLQQLECYREILEKDLITSQDAHLRHAMAYSSYGHKNSRHLGDDGLVPKSRMFRSMSASGPEGNTIRSDEDRLNPSLMLSPVTNGNKLFWANGNSGNVASPITDHDDTFDSTPSRDSISSTARLVVPLSPSRSSALPGSPLSQEFYDPIELEARLQKQDSPGRSGTSMAKRRTIFMDEVNENGEPIQDASGTRRSSCPQIPPVDPGMLTSPMSLAPDLTILEIEDRERAAAAANALKFAGHRYSGEQSRSSSRRSSHSISDTPTKSVRGVWDWAAAAAKSATTAIKGTVSAARDDSASSSPHGSPHGSRSASPAPYAATTTVTQMEKLLRRRSRSNPIKPSVAIVSAGHGPALLGVGLDTDGGTLGGRDRSNSESSFLRDDDELSVVLVDEEAGAEDDAEQKGLIVMDDEDEDGEEIEVVDLVETEEAGEAEEVTEEQGLKGEEGGGGKSGTSE